MDYKENKITKIFHWVYIAVIVHALWLVGLLLGLGIFSLIPTTITSYEIINQVSNDYTRPRLKVFSFWWDHYKKNLHKYKLTSFIWSFILWILLMNYSFLNLQTNFVTYIAFYVTLFVFIFALKVLFWFSFIAAKHPELEQKDLLKNAILFPLARMVESIILMTLLTTLLILVWSWTPGLIVFTGFGFLLMITHWSFNKIYSGYGVHQLFQGWRS